MLRCEKEWQSVRRFDNTLEAWELILKLVNETGFVSNLGDNVISCDKE